MKPPRWLLILMSFWSGLFLLGCLLVPLLTLIGEGLRHGVGKLILDPVLLSALAGTLKQVFWSTGISALLGLPLGLMLGKESAQHESSRLVSLFYLPMGIPSLVAAIAWVGVLGRSGWLASIGISLPWLYSFEAVILAHCLFNIPWVAFVVAQARKKIEPLELEAMRSLGASAFHVLSDGVWPQVKWAWASAVAQVMSLCAMSFVLVLILGGGPPVGTLETEIYQSLRYGSMEWSRALLGAFWQLALTLLPWAAVLYFQSREKFVIQQRWTHRKITTPIQSSRREQVQKVFLWGCGILFISPYFLVYQPSSAHQVWKVVQSSQVLASLQLSLALATWSSLLAVMTASALLFSISSLKRWPKLKGVLSWLATLPSGISAMVLGLGLWMSYRSWVDPFSGSPGLMILLQSTLFFPMAFRTLWPVAQASDSRWMDAAATLGASYFSAWMEFEFPRWRIPLLAASGSVFGACIGEVGAVSLFASYDWIPFPLLISLRMQRYRFDESIALAGVLLACSLGVMLGVSELGRRMSQEKSE